VQEQPLQQVAETLGCTVTNIGVRLARGREMLRKRLTKRGMTTVSAAALGGLLASEAGAAAVPAEFVCATTKAAALFVAGQTIAAGGVISAKAATLAKGVLQTMLYTQMKMAAAVMAGVVVLTAAGVITYQTAAGEREAAKPAKTVGEAESGTTPGAVVVSSEAVREPQRGKIEAGKPQYVSKNHEAWKARGRIVGIAKQGPDFKVTILTSEKRKVKTIEAEKLKDGGRAYEVWLEPASYIIVVSAEGYESLDIKNLEVKAGNDLRIDLEFTKAAE
jgi:hypothetical protein